MSRSWMSDTGASRATSAARRKVEPGSVPPGGAQPGGAQAGRAQAGGAQPGGAHLGRAPQQSRSREKVARILATTARLLEQRPYEEIGTKLIAAEAGVSVGILYRFFPDKEAIV